VSYRDCCVSAQCFIESITIVLRSRSLAERVLSLFVPTPDLQEKRSESVIIWGVLCGLSLKCVGFVVVR